MSSGYTSEFKKLIKNVEATRAARIEIARSGEHFPALTMDQRKEWLDKYHPDYKDEGRRKVALGPNKGDVLPEEVAGLLESRTLLDIENVKLDNPDYETDVLVIGAGGSGTAAALTAEEAGCEVILATKLRHGGGTSRKRMHSAGDMTGAEIMRVVRDEARNRTDKIKVLEFSPAVELLTAKDGSVCGAVLYNLETKEYYIVKAKSVVIATGGFGRLHIQGFPTTNHYGATADGIVMAYRAGAELQDLDSTQYHPTGCIFPEQNVGLLITEKVRGLGAQLLNIEGEQFCFPLEPRDVESACILRECLDIGKGIQTPTGRYGVWLDSPMIDILHGEGTVRKELPAKYIQFKRYNIDISKVPMLVYPTLHYQNGGLAIDDKSRTNVAGLYASGEVSGGVHGRNRLMGNSLLDVLVFGRRAGASAAENAKATKKSPDATLDHLRQFDKELKKAGITDPMTGPIILPEYTPEHVKSRQWD